MPSCITELSLLLALSSYYSAPQPSAEQMFATADVQQRLTVCTSFVSYSDESQSICSKISTCALSSPKLQTKAAPMQTKRKRNKAQRSARILNDASDLSISSIRICKPKFFCLIPGYHLNNLPQHDNMVSYTDQASCSSIWQQLAPEHSQNALSFQQRRRTPSMLTFIHRICCPFNRIKHTVHITPCKMISDCRAAFIAC